MQLGVRNDAAANTAEAAGVEVIMNRCPKIEFGRLGGEFRGAGSTAASSRASPSPRRFSAASGRALRRRRTSITASRRGRFTPAQRPIRRLGACSTPIYQTTAYVFDDVDHAASLFNLHNFGYIYSRLTNPTVSVLEERIAALEGGAPRSRRLRGTRRSS